MRITYYACNIKARWWNYCGIGCKPWRHSAADRSAARARCTLIMRDTVAVCCDDDQCVVIVLTSRHVLMEVSHDADNNGHR